MSRGCSQGQTHRFWDYVQLYIPKGSGKATGSFRRFTSYLPPSFINYYSVPFLGSHPAAGRYLDAGDAAALSRAL